jgi:EAL domain-containing protein (putative c-di-GMP-specific phosphodiesterase class I)/ActR/RegA family two-component response regulator
MAAAHRSRLLILEDDSAVGRVIHTVATAGGHEALVITQPDRFFRAIEEWQPTHIMLDLVLPDMDGIQILTELGARTCAVAIIITSGVGARVLDAALHAAHEHGLNIVGLLAKPFSPAALLALLAKRPGSPGQLEAGSAAADAAPQFTEAQVRAAMDHEEFKVQYQPKVGCSNGRLAGFEALVRWRRPKRRTLMPDEFIPFAEKHALIDDLTAIVLDQALAWFGPRFVDTQAASYLSPLHVGTAEISLSINLSASSLRDMRLVDRIMAACLRHRVPATRVILELTANSPLESRVARELLTGMRVNGFQLSFDGMGQPPIQQLVLMAFTEIKVDKTFVIAACESSDARAVVKSMVDLARSLGVKSVANGVEDAGTLTLLREMGCDFAQGYWIGRPMGGSAIPHWLAGRRSAA